jgi:N-acylglucosamine-6-phosphate 2-epimerase
MEQIRGGLVVSCQAMPDEPLYGPIHMTAIARAAVMGGAKGIRANGVDDVAAIRSAVDVPLIGLWKVGRDGVFITPTAAHALQVAQAGADIVAVDGTCRQRPDARAFVDTVKALHAETDALVLADISTLDEGLRAQEAGADAVATTLSGYTPHSSQEPGPNLALLRSLVQRLAIPVLAEGRISTPGQAQAAKSAGAWAVVVGGAITRPATITARYVAAL